MLFLCVVIASTCQRKSPSTEFQVVSTCPFLGHAWSLPPATVSDSTPQTAWPLHSASQPAEKCLLSSQRKCKPQISQEISRPNLCPAQLSPLGLTWAFSFSYLFPSGCLATPLDPSQAWNVSPVLDSKHPVIRISSCYWPSLPLTLKLPEWSLPSLTFLTPQPPQFGSLSKQL